MKNLSPIKFYILILFIVLSACLGCSSKPSTDKPVSRQAIPNTQPTIHIHSNKSSCVFCNICLGKEPAQIFSQNDLITAFKDRNPQPTVHTLVVPNDHILNLADITVKNSELLGQMLVKCVKLGNEQCQNGFRVITNTGADAHQSIFHLHFHVLGGEDVGVFPEAGFTFDSDTDKIIENNADITTYQCVNSRYKPHFIISLNNVHDLASVSAADVPLLGEIFIKISEYGQFYFNNNYRVVMNYGNHAHQEKIRNPIIHIIGTRGNAIPVYAFSISMRNS
jgi:histidine triad (HIT) family protein